MRSGLAPNNENLESCWINVNICELSKKSWSWLTWNHKPFDYQTSVIVCHNPLGLENWISLYYPQPDPVLPYDLRGAWHTKMTLDNLGFWWFLDDLSTKAGGFQLPFICFRWWISRPISLSYLRLHIPCLCYSLWCRPRLNKPRLTPLRGTPESNNLLLSWYPAN